MASLEEQEEAIFRHEQELRRKKELEDLRKLKRAADERAEIARLKKELGK